MTNRRLGGVVAAVLAGILCSWNPALGHPFDIENKRPESYSELVHMIRDGLRNIQQPVAPGDSVELGRRASRLADLSAAVPRFALTLSSALQDSSVGRILAAGIRLGALAEELRRIAGREDHPDLGRQMSLGAELTALLEAHVPARYVCPMHCEPGKLYDRPGLCPVCTMHLQQITTDRYSVEVRSADGPVRAGVPVTLGFQIRDPAGFAVRDLRVVHEKTLHLIIVSQDLSRFDHVHPVPGPDGSFSLRHTFPAGGSYVLFHDFTPDSVGMQVVPVELPVQGAEPAPVALVADDTRPKRIAGCEIEITHSRLIPGEECTIAFTLRKRGRPVTDLQPFLGTAGHLVLISQDHAVYLHSHPLEAAASSGPTVEFRMRFERTGLYKGWGQFQRAGHVLTVPFVVEVALDTAARENAAPSPGQRPRDTANTR